MHRRLLLVAALATLAGCGSGSQPLAEVGARSVTRADFEAAARDNWQPYGVFPDSARRLLLEDLVRRDLLLAAADHEGLFRDSVTIRAARRAEEQALTRALIARLVDAATPVSDSEIATLYRWVGTQAHLQMIYAPDRDAANGAMAQLKAGADFAEVSNHFTPGGLIPPGGDVGWLTPGTLVPPLDDFLREAPVGVIQGPAEAPGQGWFIVRVLGRRPAPQRESFEAMRGSLAEMLRQRKARLQSTRAYDDLKRAYHVQIAPDGPGELFQIARRQADPESTTRRQPTPAERALVLARYDDGAGRRASYTVADVLEELLDVSTPHPDARSVPALGEWIESRVLARVMVFEARRRRLDEEPQVRSTYQNQIDNRVLEDIYVRLVASAVHTDDEAVRRAYAAHAAEFPKLDEIHAMRVMFPDSASTAALTGHAAHMKSLREAVAMAGLRQPLDEVRVSFPTRDPAWQHLEPALETLSPGDWGGPYPTPKGWMVIQLLDKRQSQQEFAQLPDAVRQRLTEEATERARDARLVVVTDSLRRAIRPYALHAERLARIPWPVPGAVAP